ncbi:MAG: hypothetical protein G4V63_31795, partial [Candidatus Afipia apatlaquensis]|nr:hypothetical protein [Candidatus Afipia apatlaquensis]
MVPGGITEVVWHFAGYLKIINDIARDRIEYDESSSRSQQNDYVAKLPTYDNQPDVDEFDSRASWMPESAPFDELHGARVFPIKKFHLPLPAPDLDFDPSGNLPRFLSPSAAGGAGGGLDQKITVQYQSGGEQTLLQVTQINFLNNDNNLLVIANRDDLAADTALVTAQSEFLAVETQALVQRMADGANDQIPKEWWVPQNDQGITDFSQAHSEYMASLGGTPEAHSVQPGYYLNGVLQDPAPTPPDQTPPPATPPAPDLGHDLGQWAIVGGNHSLNAALIVDLTESGRSMIVMGDYFKTNAIFQTNSTMDHDHVDVAGGNAFPVLTGGDQVNNIADFVQHPGIYASLPAHFAGPHWSVDVVDGNYYDVHTLVQMNYLSENNIIVQQSSDSHYVINAGGNELGNLAQIYDGSIHYDLIIVAGGYHGMNVIFQNNILLNNNTIKMLADGSDPSQSVVSGQNELTNTATIENYGSDNFKSMNSNLDSLVSAVGNGATTLDPSYGEFVDGSGGVFNVLYVKGDYYDVNAVWQTNVTSNVNVILQLLGAPSAAALAQHPGAAETQSIVSGKNLLTNDAAIVDVGATNTYVDGQVYGDTILVQANLLPDDKDNVLAHDTQALVPELIAFVNDSQHEAPAAQPVLSTP